ncbi:hypothetical protein [Wenyingzhuangia sp. 2_MG-2023]|uniref:hypothetical protein n=1 Tax=Wenyingzhuangia sp. 2_MG-2023 TaxID=3062639 RepID=UPI0026E339E3|nr:hypothetical protein [Wenyingzhuangia sp. 2_MG-2023]MDO6737123.1 hypothetical protein [Wenyingzhuangia sp. 2_MG-2023]
MENIVQLRKTQYDDLVEKAEMNEAEIEKRADELYQKNGTYAISIEPKVTDFDNKIKIKASAYVSDWNSKFPISDKDKRKIVQVAEEKAANLLENAFGDIIYNINAIKSAKAVLRNRIRLFTGVSVTGWILAIIGILVILFKN